MNVGDYVQVKVPSSNKIVAGLVEEINTQNNTAVVRLRSSSDAANTKRDETITVPVDSLQSLGVSRHAQNDATVGGAYQASGPGSPSAMLLQHGKYSGTSASFENSDVYDDVAQQHRRKTDPFRNFDDAGNLGKSTALVLGDDENGHGGNSVLLREMRAKQASAGFYRHGIFSKYVWEFFSPVAVLLRAERPLFSAGFVVLYLIIHFCVSLPRVVVETACFGVSRLIRDVKGTPLPSVSTIPSTRFLNNFENVGGKEEEAVADKPSLKKSFEQTLSKKQKEKSVKNEEKSAKKEKFKAASSTIKSKGDSTENEKEDSTAVKSQQQQQQQVEKSQSLSSSYTTSGSSVFDEIDQFFEERIILYVRLFFRDAGLMFEDLLTFSNSVIPSHIQPTESLFGNVCHQLKQLKQSTKANNINNEGGDSEFPLVIPEILQQDIKTIGRKISLFFYCIILCYMWSGSVRCEILSSSSSSSSQKSHKNSSSNSSSSTSLNAKNKSSSSSSLEKQAEFQDIEEGNRLLDDAVEDDAELEQQQQQQKQQELKNNSFTSRFRFKIQEQEFLRLHNRMKKLEVEIHYPDIALRRFLKEFASVIVLHLGIIFLVSICGWCVAIVEERPVGTASSSQYRLVYASSLIEAILSPAGDLLLDFGMFIKDLTFEFWLLQSFTINIVINNVTSLLKKRK